MNNRYLKVKRVYIPSPDYLMSMYENPQLRGRWSVAEKVAIENIKIDRSLFSFQNEVNWKDVEYMINNFDQSVWFPIMVNTEYYLLDGQHRLAAAKIMKLEYIDIVIDHEK